MSTPFDTESQAVVSATDNQVMHLRRMMAERDWNMMADAKPKFVARVAVLNLVSRWAAEPMADNTPPKVSRAINNAVGRGATYGERINAILAALLADDPYTDEYGNTWAPLSKGGASALISWLSTLPRTDRVELVKDATTEAAKATQRTEDFPAVPAGRYAVATNDGAVNALAFYKVDRPETGKWAGYVFVKHITGDDEQRLSRSAAAGVLAKIEAAGAEAAMALYGHEIGACGMCARQLTNDESRARGIGPICAAKAGW